MDIKGWTPTEGHKRAEVTVQMLEADGLSTGHRFSPEFRWRMVQTIAGAIDAALVDGSEQDALDSMVHTNGGLPPDPDPESVRLTEFLDEQRAEPKKRGPKPGKRRGRRAKAYEALA